MADIYGIAIIAGEDLEVIQPFAGKTPLEWVYEAVKWSRGIDDIAVIGTSTKVMAVAERMGAKWVQWKPGKVTDAEPIADRITQAIAGAAKKEGYHFLLLVNPMFPLIRPNDVDMMVGQLFSDPVNFAQTTRGQEPLTDEIDNTSMFIADTLRWSSTVFPEGQKPVAIAEVLNSVKRVRLVTENWQSIGMDHPSLCEATFEKCILDGDPDVYRRSYERIMTEKGYQQTATMYNKGVENNLLPLDYRASHVNHFRIWAEFSPHDPEKKIKEWRLMEEREEEGIKISKCVNVIRAHSATPVGANKVKEKEPAIIVGSGRSLNDSAPILKNWKGAIFCSTSQAATLAHAGCYPSHIVAYDVITKPEELSETAEPLWYHGCRMVTHPGMNPLILDYWKGDKIYFRELDSSNHYFARVLPLAYGAFIPDAMYLFSCSLAAQMSLAFAMGYSPLILTGADFGASRFDRWFFKDGEWKVTKGPEYLDGSKEEEAKSRKLLKASNGEWTRPMNAFYKRSCLCVWRIDRSQCLMTSPLSIITEMPQVDIKEVVENQGRGLDLHYLDENAIIDRVEAYLAQVNQFFIRFREGGVKVVEAPPGTWEADMKQYMLGMARALAAASEDTQLIDIDANMKRFRELKERAGNGGRKAAIEGDPDSEA